MGLCKCPRKKVTNLFCFEHRVNVCEHCLLSRHAQCVVQSYLEWLQDSDYDPNCSFCSQPLANEKVPTARLTCLHVYHWHCLNSWAQQFPSHTAPAGYQCPACRTSVIPKQNLAGPIAESLREQLKQANWARQGLGLELLPDVPSGPAGTTTPMMTSSHGGHNATSVHSNQQQSMQTTRVQMENDSSMVSRKPVYNDPSDQHDYLTSSNSPLLGHDGGSGGGNGGKRDADAQDNKYKRRSAMEWFSTWIRSRTGGRAAMDPFLSYKRWLFLIILLLIGLVTVIIILTRVASSGDEYDPFLDPLANPNIRIGDLEARKQDIMGHHM